MRVKKVSPQVYENLVWAKGKAGDYMKIPSKAWGSTFMGILHRGVVCVAWPDNLTEDEMKLYIERFGDLPELVEVKDNAN